MAIPNDYIDKITNKDSGESRIISPAADKVRVDNENFEGTDLDEVLDEVAHAIDEAGSGDGTVTGVQVGETTYRPNQNGVVDLSTPLDGKVDKETGKGLSSNDYTTQERDKLAGLSNYDDTALQAAVVSLQNALAALVGGADVQGAIDTFNEVVAFLSGISSSDTLAAKLATLVPQTRTVNGKALSGNVTIGINDIEGLAAALANAGSGNVSVIQPDPADGTFTIRVGSNDYTINLNHTHENMAKLVVCEESDLPSTLAKDTIYAQVNDADNPTEIETLYIAGLEFTGGGLPAGVPQINKPPYNSTINLGTIYGQGGATGTVKIKGRSLTANSTVVVSVGSGFSLSYGQQSGSSINIDSADVVLGCDVTVYATAYGTEGTMTIVSQTDNISVEVELTSNVVEELAGVKLTGSQWLETDYHTNPQTKIVMDCLFEKNSITENQSYSGTRGQQVLNCRDSAESGVTLGTGSPAEQVSKAYDVNVWLQRSYSFTEYNYFYSHAFNNENTFCNRSTLTIDAPNTFISFQGVSWATDTKTNTQTANLVVGYSQSIGSIFNCFDLTIYSLKLYNGSTLVRDYSPKRINGVVGLLDSVDGGFISSKTQTALEPITTV